MDAGCGQGLSANQEGKEVGEHMGTFVLSEELDISLIVFLGR